MQIYRTVVGNAAPDLAITCERNGTPINITNATVTFILRNERTGIITNATQTTGVVDAVNGLVTYTPLIADYPTQDRYIGTIKIVYQSGKPEYLPERVLIVANDP